MPSSYSTNLKIELQATGENSGTWGTITNTNLGTALEQAVVGYGNPSYPSDANLTLTYTDTNAAQAARALVLNVTSAVSLSATRELVVPTIQKQYIVQNNTSGSQSITVKTSAGTGITVPNGRKAHLYVNGTDVIFMDDFVDINGGSIDGTTIGANSAAAGNFTTVDTTNIEVTNLKAKDGTTAGSIADATGVVTLGSSVLTTTDINGGTIDGTTIGGSSAAAGTFTTLTTSSTVTLNGGTANGVLYLNGSKVATSGSALVFDGTNLNIGASATFYGAQVATSGSIAVTGGNYLKLWNTGGTGVGGISSPGTDTIAFGLGASFTEGMRLTSTGLGIGTASPAAKLDVNGNGTIRGELAAILPSSVGSITARNSSTTTTELHIRPNSGKSGWVSFTEDSVADRWIVGVKNGNGGLFFNTGSPGSNTDRMLLDSSGNLGIGTASPTNKLNVSGNGYLFALNGGLTNRVAQTFGNTGGGLDLGIEGSAGGTVFTGGSSYAGVIGTNNATVLQLGTNGTIRATLDTSGNLGLGVTPSAWSQFVAFEMGARGNSISSYNSGGVYVGSNCFFNGTNWIYKISGVAPAQYYAAGGIHAWQTAASGTAGNTISFTEAMRLDASGNLGVGTTSPAAKLDVVGGTGIRVNEDGASTKVIQVRSNFAGVGPAINVVTNDPLLFQTNNAERARITSGGDLLVGTTSGSNHTIYKATSSTILTVTSNTGADSVYINGVDATGANLGTNAALYVQKNNASGRSINAAGTVNASGADYAEYMLKAGNFVIAKGDLCGIDANGKLTNVFADSVSFVVKSTNPSYVGGDTWANEESIGKKPTNENELVEWYNRAEESRQKVDRIAFAGQVPVNVLGATPGQYIVPINDNGAIKGVAVSNPTFEQYQSAVGKVIAVQDDGRALIIVKVA